MYGLLPVAFFCIIFYFFKRFEIVFLQAACRVICGLRYSVATYVYIEVVTHTVVWIFQGKSRNQRFSSLQCHLTNLILNTFLPVTRMILWMLNHLRGTCLK